MRRMLAYGTALMIAVGVSWASPATAQPRGYPQQPGRGSYDVQRQPRDQGYRAGLAEGARDARDGRRADYRRHEVYKDGERGYDRRYGNRGQYKQAFRDGFSQGYADGYSRYAGNGRAVPRRDGDYGRYPDSGRYPNDRRYPDYGRSPDYRSGGNYGYGSPALDRGFSEGYEKGSEDARDGDRVDPQRHKWYREGDRGYDKRYGSRDAYKNQYRDAFRQGYERGYRESRGGYGNQRGGGWWPF